MGRHETAFEAHKELELLDIIKEQLAQIGLADDEESFLSAVQSETNIFEVIEKMTIIDAEIDEDIEKLDRLMKLYAGRKARAAKSKELLKALFSVVMERINQSTIRHAYGTVTRKRNPRNIKVVKEQEIPTEFWIVPPALPVIDNRSLKETVLNRFNERQAELDRIRAPFSLAIAEAQAIPDEARRIAALEEIDAKLLPDITDLEFRLPMVPGVEVLDQTYAISILRKAK